MSKHIQIHRVPFYSQNVVKNFIEEKFGSVLVARYWSLRICGLVCLKMTIATYFPDKVIPISELLNYGRKIQAYNEEKGWLHDGLIKIGKKYGLAGKRASILSDVDAIAHYISHGNVVIASIGPKFEGEHGGHLVVVFAVDMKNGQVESLYLHHTSPDKKYEWKNYKISRESFLNSFSVTGNIICFTKKNDSRNYIWRKKR